MATTIGRQAFALSRVLISLIYGISVIGKLAAIFERGEGFNSTDPLLGIPLLYSWLIACSLDIAIIYALAVLSSNRNAMGAVMFIGLFYTSYHVLLLMTKNEMCPCFGRLLKYLGLSYNQTHTLSFATAAATVFLGYLLIRKADNQAKTQDHI